MFNRFLRFFKFLQLKRQNSAEEDKKPEELLPERAAEVETRLKEIFAECSDFNLREVVLSKRENLTIVIAYLDGLINKDLINRDILKPIMQEADREIGEITLQRKREAGAERDKGGKRKVRDRADRADGGSDPVNFLKEQVLNISELTEVTGMQRAVDYILTGDTLLFIDGKRTALKAGTRGWETRGVEEPDTEVVVRGPREGFTETLRTNTALLRRKIKNPNLKFEMMSLGKQTRTEICICYIKGLIHEDILKTLKRRLERIKTDAVLESGYIEEFIEDAPLSLFATVANSEKPDVVAGKILEGRAAVLCDGTPFVLTVPHLFIESLISAEDYYARPYFSTLVRWLRLLALLITTFLPGFYVASVAFHQDVIPFKLLLTIAESREGIPFSVFTETLLMGITYELLREAGVRMPRPVGQAISIVGALVLGEAAVEAGVASNPVIIVTAITAITSFILPPLGGTIPIIRIALIIAANIMGYMGIMLVLIIIYIHLCSLRSFGIPFMAPFSPLCGMDLKDTIIRVPVWAMWLRPRTLMVDHYDYMQKGYRMKRDIRTKED